MPTPLATPSTLQGTANVHVWARIFAWMPFAVRARTVNALRSTCVKGRLGFDVAVHAGWIPLAAHEADVPEDDGATCRWVGGWFPITVGAAQRLVVAVVPSETVGAGDAPTSSLRAPPVDNFGNANQQPFVIRMEHRLVAPTNFRISWAAPHVVVCETMRAGEERPGAADEDLTTKMLSTCAAERVSFQLAPTTTAVKMTALNGCRRTAVAIDTAGFGGHVSSVGEKFLHGFLKLTDVNLDGLGGVCVLPDQFIANCFHLETVTTSPGLRNVRTVMTNFLAGNCALTRVDLAGLANVTELGDFFMRGCSSLEVLDVGGLRSVRVIGKNLFSGCSSINHFENLQALSNVASIGPEAFAKCEALADFDASCFTSLTALGEGFMSHCEALQSIDFVPLLEQLAAIPSCFMMECRQLKSVSTAGTMARLPPPPPRCSDDVQARVLGYGFLTFSKSLESFSTSAALFNDLSTIEGAFMSHNVPLRAVDLSGLTNVTDIDDGFLSGCVSLERLSTRGMTSVTSIGDFFAANCEAVLTIDLSDVAETVRRIGSGFLAGTSSVAEITGYDTDRGFANLDEIGMYALSASSMEHHGTFNDALHAGIHRRAASAAVA